VGACGGGRGGPADHRGGSSIVFSPFFRVFSVCFPSFSLVFVGQDYTHPDAAVENCAWYRDRNIPFVMGTTGYDVEAARAAIGPDLYAVLAPNMGKPIVLFQSMLEHAASA
jgi:hypothetical protein